MLRDKSIPSTVCIGRLCDVIEGELHSPRGFPDGVFDLKLQGFKVSIVERLLNVMARS